MPAGLKRVHPTSLDGIIGSSGAVATLKTWVEYAAGSPTHILLEAAENGHGGPGAGKSTSAHLLAAAMVAPATEQSDLFHSSLERLCSSNAEAGLPTATATATSSAPAPAPAQHDMLGQNEASAAYHDVLSQAEVSGFASSVVAPSAVLTVRPHDKDHAWWYRARRPDLPKAILAFAAKPIQLAAGCKRVVIVEDVEMLTGPAQRSLLATMEQCAATVRFVLIFDGTGVIDPDLRGVCTSVVFDGTGAMEVASCAKRFCVERGIGHDDLALDALAWASQGGIGLMYRLLDATRQVFGYLQAEAVHVVAVGSVVPPKLVEEELAWANDLQHSGPTPGRSHSRMSEDALAGLLKESAASYEDSSLPVPVKLIPGTKVIVIGSSDRAINGLTGVVMATIDDAVLWQSLVRVRMDRTHRTVSLSPANVEAIADLHGQGSVDRPRKLDRFMRGGLQEAVETLSMMLLHGGRLKGRISAAHVWGEGSPRHGCLLEPSRTLAVAALWAARRRGVALALANHVSGSRGDSSMFSGLLAVVEPAVTLPQVLWPGRIHAPFKAWAAPDAPFPDRELLERLHLPVPTAKIVVDVARPFFPFVVDEFPDPCPDWPKGFRVVVAPKEGSAGVITAADVIDAITGNPAASQAGDSIRNEDKYELCWDELTWDAPYKLRLATYFRFYTDRIQFSSKKDPWAHPSVRTHKGGPTLAGFEQDVTSALGKMLDAQLPPTYWVGWAARPL